MTAPIATQASILIVEDDPVLRFLLQEVLSDLGREIIAIESADQGLVALHSQQICLLVTDVQTPGELDGWKLVWLTHQQDPKIPIIITSGFHLHPHDSRPPSAVYLQKPWVAGRLHQLAVELIQRSSEAN